MWNIVNTNIVKTNNQMYFLPLFLNKCTFVLHFVAGSECLFVLAVEFTNSTKDETDEYIERSRELKRKGDKEKDRQEI